MRFLSGGPGRTAGATRVPLALTAFAVSAISALSPSLSIAASSGAAASGDPSGGAAPASYTVQVDGHTPENHLALTAYFPKAVSVHPGDTITFPLADSGEPHTVTFGKDIDDALAAFAAGADPTTDPAILKVPPLLPNGPGDAIQSAANPCYLATGDPDTDECAQVDQPAFDGTQTFYNSGWLAPDQDFTVTLSPDIKPGTYGFMCLLHSAGMTGTVTVVDPSTAVKTPDEVTAEGQTELDAVAQPLAAAAEAAQTQPDGQALAGVFDPNVQVGQPTIFAPSTTSIPVGGSVTWTILGPHTISFNSPQDAIGPRIEAPDGTIHVNAKIFTPAGGPGQPPPPSGPPDPSAPPTLIDAGTWDGTAYLSSGAILSFPPQLYQYKVTFSTAGTYKYICQIHVDMQGTVKVG
jgi:plastocyanin